MHEARVLLSYSQLFVATLSPLLGARLRRNKVCSSSVAGQGKGQELGAGVDEGHTSTERGEGLFYLHPRTMALESNEQTAGEVSFCPRNEIDTENKTECQDT